MNSLPRWLEALILMLVAMIAIGVLIGAVLGVGMIISAYPQFGAVLIIGAGLILIYAWIYTSLGD